MADLRERLNELADDAPGSLPTSGLWERGKRRQRVRRAAAAAAAAVCLATVVGSGVALLGGGNGTPRPAETPSDELHLPDRIYMPDPWSEGTAEAGEIGPLAAIGSAERLRPRGWDGELNSYEVYGVSSVDGEVRFLDLPLDEEEGEQAPWGGPSEVALSPDGRLVAYEVRVASSSEALGSHVTGWRLYDTVTGETSDLLDPERPRLWTAGNDLAFTADSRYLLTTYLFHGAPTANGTHGLVAWDVKTGERIVLEEPGHYWQPGIGAAPRGLLIQRKSSVRWIDPDSGDIERFRLPKAVVSSSIGPDGKAFAYVGGDWTPGRDGGINGHTWRVYAGPDRDHLEQIELPEGDLTGVVLGWSDARHVILSGWSQEYAEVDVVTGEVRTFEIPGSGGGPATKAQDLWVNDLVPGVEPPDAGDPRTPWKIGLGIFAGVGFVILLLARRRRRRGGA